LSLISLINRFPLGTPAEKGYFLYTKLPPGLFQKMEADGFRGTVRYVAENSPFYKRKFKEHGIDAAVVKTPADLGNFFTTAEDIRQNPDEFLCAPADTAYESTGTTSKRTKRVYFSRNEVEEAGWAGAVGLWGLGVRPTDRVVSAFDYSFWVSGPVLVASCKVLGCFHVEAGRLMPEEFYERLADYKVTVIVGDPSWLLRLSEIAEKKGAWPIKLMIGGGENLTEEARRYIERVWKCDFILSYGQTEAFGAIGMESLSKEGYHLNEFHNFFEIIDPDTEGNGELVYTTLNRRVMPLVRYRSGDITRFATTPSKSGMPGRRIEKLKGRVDEWTPTALGNIAPWMFEGLFGRVDGIGADWQIAVEKEGNKDRLEFRMEAADGLEEAHVRESFLSAFKSELPDVWKLYEMGLCTLDAKVMPKGSLRGPRKLRRIVDNRKF
jgi:phenylacetate-CoA ligase